MLANYKITFTTALAAFAMAPPLAAQTSVTLDGASGSQAFNVVRSTTGGLSLGLGFEVEYLLIGGGGRGGNGAASDHGGGGGGGGGVISGQVNMTNISTSVTVGVGGTADVRNGGTSSFAGIQAFGGGGGANSFGSSATVAPASGGGGAPADSSDINQGAVGGAQGNSGASIGGTGWGYKEGGGGGGAGSPGGITTDGPNIRSGGMGLSSSITGTSSFYGAGGGGGGIEAGIGGSGVGGSGGTFSGTPATSGAVNSGAGGGGGMGTGGSTDTLGANGANGMVVIRYKGTSAGTGGSVTAGTGTAAGYTLHTFTTTGESALDLSSLNLSTRLGAVENGIISGDGDLTFTGPGTLTLNATNTYSGLTRVNAGTLALGSSGSIGFSSGLSIANGANFNVSTVTGGFTLGSNKTLSGGGTIAGDVTISGTHSPGFSPGIQAIDGDLSYTVGSNVVWELINNTVSGRGTDYDGVDVSGDLMFTGSTTITLDFALLGSMVDWTNEFWNNDHTGTEGWKIFDVAGEITGFENLTLAGSTIDKDGTSLTDERSGASFYLFEGADGVYLNYAAVPEPSVALLGGLGLLALLVRRR